jgi:acetoin utilization protein AcuB
MSDRVVLIEEHMTPNPMSFPRRESLAKAMRAMREMGIRHLLLREGDAIVGIVSEREVRLFAALPGIDVSESAIELAMTPDPFSVPMGTPLAQVAAEMAERKIGSALVTDGEKVVGLFTTTDALKALTRLLA